MVEKNITEENIFNYKELEYRQWEKFSEVCKKRRYNLCVENDYPCKIDNCSSWQIINFIKFGILK
jgi:hypothetical protein